jgi:hypothetical protein
MGLDGKTPAEAAGIEIRGKDKWLTCTTGTGSEKNRLTISKLTSDAIATVVPKRRSRRILLFVGFIR